jgi:hypothetical protein
MVVSASLKNSGAIRRYSMRYRRLGGWGLAVSGFSPSLLILFGALDRPFPLK